MSGTKFWGVALDFGRRALYGVSLGRLVDDTLHSLAAGSPMLRFALLHVCTSAAKADARAAELATLPQLRGFWLVPDAAKTEEEQTDDR